MKSKTVDSLERVVAPIISPTQIALSSFFLSPCNTIGVAVSVAVGVTIGKSVASGFRGPIGQLAVVNWFLGDCSTHFDIPLMSILELLHEAGQFSCLLNGCSVVQWGTQTANRPVELEKEKRFPGLII